MYICIYVYMYICIYVYMYICIYVYIYIESIKRVNSESKATNRLLLFSEAESPKNPGRYWSPGHRFGGPFWWTPKILKIAIGTSSTAQGGGGSFKNRKPIGEVGCCESGMAERSHGLTERWLELRLLEWLQWLQWSPRPQLLDVV